MEEVKQQTKIMPRIAWSVVVIAMWSWINFFMNTVNPLVTSRMALKQFENSDTAYVASQYGMNLFSWLGGITTIILLGMLFLIWRKPCRSITKNLFVIAMLVASVGFTGTTAKAYYSKTDLTEMFYVRPNWSVFWVPDKGANLDSQGHMDSEEFYSKNRIPAKIFKIPHEIIPSSTGIMERDYYGPVGRVYVVDRSMFNQRWTASGATGTSAKDQSFHCQTKEGINVTVEATVSAMIADANAPKYLFWWGLDLQDNTNDPNIIFASVLYSRPLANVMDEVVFGEAHRLLFSEIATRTLDQVNDQAQKIMDDVFKNLKTFCADRGITLVSFGSCGTFTFDKDVQQALNDRYTAIIIGPYLEALQKKSVIDALNRWDTHLPSNISLSWIPSSISDFFERWFKSEPAPATKKK